MFRDGKYYCDYCGKEIIGRSKNHLERVKKHFCTRGHRILSTMNKIQYRDNYVVIYVEYKNERYECLVDIDDYMRDEVLPHVPDAKWFFEENVSKGVIKTGAEIPFTRYFYKYKSPESSDVLAKQFNDLEETLRGKIDNLFKK